jgi:hypothetical protein
MTLKVAKNKTPPAGSSSLRVNPSQVAAVGTFTR